MSNDSFKIGDLVITQNAIYFSEYDGIFAVVTGERAGRYAMNMNTMKEEWRPVTYQIQLLSRSERILTVTPGQIRKPYLPDEAFEVNTDGEYVYFETDFSLCSK